MLAEQQLRDFGYHVDAVQPLGGGFACHLAGEALGELRALGFSREHFFQAGIVVGPEHDVPEANRYRLLMSFLVFNVSKTITRISAIVDEEVPPHFVAELTIDLRSVPNKAVFDQMMANLVAAYGDAMRLFKDHCGPQPGNPEHRAAIAE